MGIFVFLGLLANPSVLVGLLCWALISGLMAQILIFFGVDEETAIGWVILIQILCIACFMYWPATKKKGQAPKKDVIYTNGAELVNKVNAGELSKTDAIIAYKDENGIGFNEAKIALMLRGLN